MQSKAFQMLFLTSFKCVSNIARRSPRSSFHSMRNALYSEQPSWKIPAQENKDDFSELEPDEFGTLRPEISLSEKLSKLPIEDEEEEVFDTVNEKGKKTRRSLEFYEKIITKLLKEKRIVDALEVMETRMLKKDKVRPGYHVHNLLINGCAKVGYTEKAFKLYKQMRERRIKSTPTTFTGLFNACANSPFPEDALIKLNHLRKVLNENGVDLTPINYNAMIKAYARLKDTYAAFLAADEMLNKGYSLRSDTCCFLLQSCISDKECGLRHALLVWHKMRAKRINPDLYHYNLLIRCIRDCGLGDEDEVNDVVQQILRESAHNSTNTIESGENRNSTYFTISWKKKSADSLVPTETETETLLEKPEQVPLPNTELEIVENRPNLLSKKPHLGNVLALREVKTPTDRLLLLGGFKTLLEQMKKDDVKPDIKTFTQLLNIMPSSIEAEKHLLKEMENYKVGMDIDFCNMLIKQRAFRKDYQSAKEVLTLIQANYLNPDIVTFGVLAFSCRKLHEAEELISNMKEFGYRLNIEILGAMLSGACYSLNFKYVVYIMRLTRNCGIQPSELYMEHLEQMDKKMIEMLKLKKRKSKSVPEMFNNPNFIENYRMFKDFYDQWKTQVTVFIPPHPYKQFKKDPEKDDHNKENKNEKENKRNVRPKKRYVEPRNDKFDKASFRNEKQLV